MYNTYSPESTGSLATLNNELAQKVKETQNLVDALGMNIEPNASADEIARYNEDLEVVRITIENVHESNKSLKREKWALEKALAESESARLEEAKLHQKTLEEQGRQLFLEQENDALHRKVVKIQLAYDRLESSFSSEDYNGGSPKSSPSAIIHSGTELFMKLKETEKSLNQLKRANKSLETEKVLLRQQIEKAQLKSPSPHRDGRDISLQNDTKMEELVSQKAREFSRELNQNITRLSTERDKVKSELESVQRDLREARQQIHLDRSRYNNALKALRSDLDLSKTEVRRLTDENDALSDKISAMTSSSSDLRRELEAVEGRVRTTESENLRLVQEISATRSSQEKLRGEKLQLMEKIAMDKQQWNKERDLKQQKRRAFLLRRKKRGIENGQEFEKNEVDGYKYNLAQTSKMSPPPTKDSTKNTEMGVSALDSVSVAANSENAIREEYRQPMPLQDEFHEKVQSRNPVDKFQDKPSDSPLLDLPARVDGHLGRFGLESLRLSSHAGFEDTATKNRGNRRLSTGWLKRKEDKQNGDDGGGGGGGGDDDDDDDDDNDNDDDDDDTALRMSGSDYDQEQKVGNDEMRGNAPEKMNMDKAITNNRGDEEEYDEEEEPSRIALMAPDAEQRAAIQRRRQRKAEKKARLGIPKSRQVRYERPRERLVGGNGGYYGKNTHGRQLYRVAV